MLPPDEHINSVPGFLLELEMMQQGHPDHYERNWFATQRAFDRVRGRLPYAGSRGRTALFAEALAIKRDFLRNPARQS
jgi:hypothetical protein